MGILSTLLENTGIIGKITDVIAKRIPDKDLAANLAAEASALLENDQHALSMKVLDLEASIAADQSKTNQIEAASQNIFESGWRPMVGWVCALGLLYQFVLAPLLSWASGKPLPVLDIQTLLTLLFAILGLGAYRTYEKTQ